ncbi:acyl CoA:acetate/3-ketoacid CoA transferase subunit alpha [Priestia taiwanensis]|uniref:Acyl CoA:acetate/3-ketoacid CoA transferase subunit alpha n=1 Tax=Priestia taiwanensis TaxID=1347902 RepID=A0A917ELE0_9BACI|nr:acyl CoA:acetate/3-ketoacid CoA transferase subunit alpha [Priestia taiwanensis]
MRSKVVSIEQALSVIKDGTKLMVGGFGGVGSPPSLIEGIMNKGVKDLTIICNDAGFPHIGIGKVVSNRQVSHLITSHIGSNPVAGRLMHEGELEVEFCPQGTLAERIRAGGVGLGGVLSDIGIDSVIDKDKQKVEVSGKTYMVEPAITADVAIVYAKKADTLGNVIYDKSARNMNPLMAMAGTTTVVEVEEIVEVSALSPEEIVTPGIFVKYVVQSKGVDWKWVWENQ